MFLLQAPYPAPLSSPLTGYLLHFHTYDEDSNIPLPLNNISTFYMLGNVTACTFNITVPALSQTGQSRNNNPSLSLGMYAVSFTYHVLSHSLFVQNLKRCFTLYISALFPVQPQPTHTVSRKVVRRLIICEHIY